MLKTDRQTPSRIIQIRNEFLATYCIFGEILCDTDLFNSFTFLRVHPLSFPKVEKRILLTPELRLQMFSGLSLVKRTRN